MKYISSVEISQNFVASKMQNTNKHNMLQTAGEVICVLQVSWVSVKHYQVLQSKSSHLKLAQTDTTEVRREGG